MQSKKPNKHVLIRETCFNKNSQKKDKIHNKCKNLRGFRQQDFKLKRQQQWPLDGNMFSANIDRLVCVRERKEKGKWFPESYCAHASDKATKTLCLRYAVVLFNFFNQSLL